MHPEQELARLVAGGARATARIVLTAVDGAGNATTTRRNMCVKR